MKSLSRVRLLATPWTTAHQALRPWDFPGKNTGMGCHFLLQCMKLKSESEITQSCPTLSDPIDCSPPGSSVFMQAFLGSSDSKASAYNAGDPGSIPGLGRSPGEGKGYPLQYSGLENSMDWVCAHTIFPVKAMAPHSSTLAWKIPWTEGLVGCSPWGR